MTDSGAKLAENMSTSTSQLVFHQFGALNCEAAAVGNI